jgi:cytochrome c biogenesis protein CcdA
MSMFFAFGIGMTLPLILLAGISLVRSRQAMEFLARHRLLVQRLAGLVMFVIAVWYLVLFFLPAGN